MSRLRATALSWRQTRCHSLHAQLMCLRTSSFRTKIQGLMNPLKRNSILLQVKCVGTFWPERGRRDNIAYHPCLSSTKTIRKHRNRAARAADCPAQLCYNAEESNYCRGRKTTHWVAQKAFVRVKAGSSDGKMCCALQQSCHFLDEHPELTCLLTKTRDAMTSESMQCWLRLEPLITFVCKYSSLLWPCSFIWASDDICEDPYGNNQVSALQMQLRPEVGIGLATGPQTKWRSSKKKEPFWQNKPQDNLQDSTGRGCTLERNPWLLKFSNFHQKKIGSTKSESTRSHAITAAGTPSKATALTLLQKQKAIEMCWAWFRIATAWEGETKEGMQIYHNYLVSFWYLIMFSLVTWKNWFSSDRTPDENELASEQRICCVCISLRHKKLQKFVGYL